MLIAKILQQSKIDPTEVEIFLSHLLRKDRSFIKAFPEQQLTEFQVGKLKEFTKRRAKHEPLAYILGYKEFCGLRFKIDRRAMVPRPETEDLVSQVVAHVYAVPNRNRANHWEYDQLTIVDVGTGSGNIAISLAKAIPFAQIFAVEKDHAAISLAEENIENHGVKRWVKLLKGDLLEPIKEPVDIVVANLPYIPRSRFAHLQPEVTRWEPRVALDGGKDGLEHYRRLFDQAPRVLKQTGLILYEVDGQTYTKSLEQASPIWL